MPRSSRLRDPLPAPPATNSASQDDSADPAPQTRGRRHRAAIYSVRARAARTVESLDRRTARSGSAWTARAASNYAPDGLPPLVQLMQRGSDGIAIRRLILEGQVAVLAAGLLDSERAIALRGRFQSVISIARTSAATCSPTATSRPSSDAGSSTRRRRDLSSDEDAACARWGGVLVRAVDGSVRFLDLHHRNDLQRALEQCGVLQATRSSAAYEAIFDRRAFLAAR